MRPDSGGAGPEPSSLDTSVAYSARVNNYWQGGKDNFAAGRAAAEGALAAFPGLPAAIRAGQPWRRRVTRFLVVDGGIRQFLDLGTGLPVGETIHQMAEAAQPGCRAVYVDHDPMVVAHARALLPPAGPACYRDHTQVSRFFAGLDLAEPGVVPLPQWRPDNEDEARAPTMAWAGVGRKP